MSGGCINDAARVQTRQGVYFLKWNQAKRYPGMFESEAKGLALLEQTNTLRVPSVIGCDKSEDTVFLVLEFIETDVPATDFWKNFGRGLARIHQNTDSRFGLGHDNYIGSLLQFNLQHNSWVQFFAEHRLEVQYELARSNGRAGKELGDGLARLYPRLKDIFPEEPPALLHGDLWNGNFMTGADGQAVIIDPAVYYGHRYMDLGMSLLFGGFSPEFYRHYHDSYPLEKQWEQGAEVANLYPLLVHVNLFGGGYLQKVLNILKKY